MRANPKRNPWPTAVQMMEKAASESEAYEILSALKTQQGFAGGWVLRPGKGEGWRVQAFFRDEPGAPEAGLNQLGFRRVIIPPAIAKKLVLNPIRTNPKRKAYGGGRPDQGDFFGGGGEGHFQLISDTAVDYVRRQEESEQRERARKESEKGQTMLINPIRSKNDRVKNNPHTLIPEIQSRLEGITRPLSLTQQRIVESTCREYITKAKIPAVNPAPKDPNRPSGRYSLESEHRGIRMKLIGEWIDMAAYYEGSDGNAWAYQKLGGPGNGWTNEGDISTFRATFGKRRRGYLFPIANPRGVIRKPKIIGKYTLELKNVGNPDFGQDPRIPKYGTWTGNAQVNSVIDAEKIVQAYISENDLGGGNWSGGRLIRNFDGLVIGRFAYNGVLFPDAPWFPGQKAIWRPGDPEPSSLLLRANPCCRAKQRTNPKRKASRRPPTPVLRGAGRGRGNPKTVVTTISRETKSVKENPLTRVFFIRSDSGNLRAVVGERMALPGSYRRPDFLLHKDPDCAGRWNVAELRSGAAIAIGQRTPQRAVEIAVQSIRQTGARFPQRIQSIVNRFGPANEIK